MVLAAAGDDLMKSMPLPAGYAEVQRLIPPEGAPDRALELDRALQDAKREAIRNAGRDMELYMSRIEINGANTILYAGFVPVPEPNNPLPPPLNPRNLNDAPQRVLGQLVTDNSVGFKEQRFGAGTPDASPVDREQRGAVPVGQDFGREPTPPIDIKTS